LTNELVFSAGSEGKIRIWDLKDGTCVKILNETVENNELRHKKVKKDKKDKEFDKKENDSKAKEKEDHESEDESFYTPI